MTAGSGATKGEPGADGVLRRIQSGDETAFDAAFREWYPVLVRVAAALLHDADAAEEVAQEVMLELWRRRHLISADVSLRAYLLRAVRNRALNQLRHLRVRRESETEVEAMYDAPLGADQPIVAGELSAAVRQAMADLPPRCREIFELSRVHGLKYAEIAESLGISQKTVEAQIGKALRIMREKLAAWL
ncbi:MAG TPA: RNA polymerase sigma-70 factor [Gemmatimonadaceae bacterium]|nr:RNA polymerase sigma-70 factor [Gemmatimonadaceae bacterium]